MDEFKADLYQDFKGLKTSDWEKTLKNFTTAFAQDKGDSNAPQTLPDEKDYKVIYTDTKAVEEEWINKKMSGQVKAGTSMTIFPTITALCLHLLGLMQATTNRRT